MKTRLKKISKLKDLRQDDLNANKGTDRGRQVIDASLQAFGAGRSVVCDRNGILIAGNKTVERANESGFAEDVIVVPTDGKKLVVVQRTDLDMNRDVAARELALVDNRASEVGLAWDPEVLLQLQEKSEVRLGELFTTEEWRRILATLPASNADAPDPQIERAAEFQKKWSVKPGDLWLIPSQDKKRQHRLLCGDSTDIDHVSRLMDGKRAILFATDPPYLVDYDGKNHPHAFHKKDANKDWSGSYGHVNWDESEKNVELFSKFIKVAIEGALEPNAAWYCWHASRRQALLEAAWNEHGA